MSVQRIAHRYAKSIIDLAREQNRLEDINRDMRLLDKTIEASRDLYLLLQSPIIHVDKKQAVIDLIFRDKLQDMTLLFIHIAIRKRREPLLNEICKAFIRQYNILKSIETAKLITAAPVEEEVIEDISLKLKKALNKEKVELATEVDEKLIGGFILQFENKQLDASLRHQLDEVAKSLKQ